LGEERKSRFGVVRIAFDPKRTIIRFRAALVCMIVSACFLVGRNLVTDNSSPTVNSYSVHEDQLKWFDVPLVAGGKAAVLFGDPTKAGTVVLRFKFPPNRQTPPHRHPYAEYTTILSGKVYYGEGENFDMSNPEIGKIGTFAVVPAGQAHFVWTLDEEAIVQLQFEGPSCTIFLDAADDPQRR
jgi:quercetin dioxygenase-like cupin family protein